MRRLAILVALMLGGCNTPTITTSPADPVPPSTSPAPSSPAAERAQIGDAILLSGTEPGVTVEVTLLDVTEPYASEGVSGLAQPGEHFAALEFRFVNVGDVVWDDFPSNGARVIDTADHQASSYITGEPNELADLRLEPGDTRAGVIYFLLSSDARIRTLQLALDSGFAEQTGQWDVD